LPYFVVAVMLAVSAAGLAFVRLRPVPAGPPAEAAAAMPSELDGAEHDAPETARRRWHEAFEGLRVIRRKPMLLRIISLDLFAVLFGGAVALLPAIAEQRLGVGAVGLGWLRAAYGIGAALTTVAIAWRPVHRHVGLVMFASVAVFGAATIVFGATTSFAVAFVRLMVGCGAGARR